MREHLYLSASSYLQAKIFGVTALELRPQNVNMSCLTELRVIIRAILQITCEQRNIFFREEIKVSKMTSKSKSF